MNTLALHRTHWLSVLFAWMRHPTPTRPRRPSKPVVRIAGLR